MSYNGRLGCMAIPTAGTDTHSLVVYGSRIAHQEKVHIVWQIVLDLESAGVA
jgi:hypothetical protein